MTRRDALVRVIDALHAEISALKANDVSGLERATSGKLKAIETLQQLGDGPATPELRGLAEEADRLNDTCRIYVNLMAANVRRRLQVLSADSAGAYGRGKLAYA
ncbi:flagellar protein FlgN [Sphingomonas sp. RHCKR47]|uniref:flagellar protein FlgN n=1 Tax=Sphingomonas citricola TaxID=2862498 RepID=UPI001CA4CB98|nr:flagellar protein FlgN [Sphingomonas citricola]MBW6524072.1 flagellar protein FlgN [Sphingomonas citricola]